MPRQGPCDCKSPCCRVLAVAALLLHVFAPQPATSVRLQQHTRDSHATNSTSSSVASKRESLPRKDDQAPARERLENVQKAWCLEERPDAVVPMYELVIARYNENLDWIAEVPCLWSITIYDKDGWEHPATVPHTPCKRPVLVVPLEDAGRESETYARHIINRFETLADYTAFTQGNPFLHNRFYLDLLKQPALLGAVQTMSLMYLEDGRPMTGSDSYRRHNWYRSERLSLRTLDSVYFHDDGTTVIMNQYLNEHMVPAGTNIIAHYLKSMGLHDWVPESQELGSFAYGGMLGAHKSKILRHPRPFYEKLRATVLAHDVHGYVQERCWIMIFGGNDFNDV